MKDHDRIDDELIEMKAAVQRALAALELGPPQQLDPLTLYPLFRRGANQPAVRLFESILEEGRADVEPLRLGDRRYLKMICRGSSPGLVVLGQIAADRAVLASRLIPANAQAVLPAWQFFNRPARLPKKPFDLAPLPLRRRLLRLAPAIGSFDATESDDDAPIGVCRPSSGKTAVQRGLAKRPSGSRRNSPSGLLVTWGQRILGMDLFGSPQLYAPLHDRLIASYLDESPALAGTGDCTPEHVRGFLARVGSTMQPRRRTLGDVCIVNGPRRPTGGRENRASGGRPRFIDNAGRYKPDEGIQIEGTDLIGSVVACRHAVYHLVALTTGH